MIIEHKTVAENLSINIYDAAGRSVKKINQVLRDNKIKIDIHGLTAGTYFVEIQTAQREKYSGQIVVIK